MIPSILLFLDFGLLGIVFFVYFRRTLRERNKLQGQAEQSVQLQQQVYQIQVLQEIGERIGYSLDTNKIVEIITSSIGTLLDYDTVTYLLFADPESMIFKCHVHNSVPHRFIDEVKNQMLQSISAICGQEVNLANADERITGTILDDHLNSRPESYVNVPIIISDQLLGIINVASSKKYLYGNSQAQVLYSITNQAATAVTKLESVLENEKGRLASTLYSMTDGVFMVDLHNQLQVYNPAVVDLLQLRVVRGKDITMFDIINALAGKVDLRTKIEEAVEKHMPIVISEVYLRDQALELTITPVRDQQGEKRGVSVVLHDITSEKALEKLRQEFTAMMVHELRAPLTAVRWSSDALLKTLADVKAKPDNAKLKESMANISTATINMLELVNDLLDVAKIEAGKFELNEQDYNLVEIVTDQVKIFEAQVAQKHLTLALIAPPNCRVKCDKVRISQVMDNLLSNAIKYTDSGSIEVNVSIEAQSNRAVVAIKDTGVGVTREDLNQLFSKFKQLSSSDRSRKGTGLGLVVSKGIMEAHGGRVWAESAGENLGSTFYFSLPLEK